MDSTGHLRPNPDTAISVLPEFERPHPVDVLDNLVGWSPRTRRRHVAAGRVRVIRIGRRVFVTDAELRRVLTEGTDTTP